MIDEKELLEEIEDFKKEKERIKAIVGEIGGIGASKQNRVVNGLFMGIIFLILIVGVAFGRLDLTTTLLLASLIGIFKVVWMTYENQKISHFQFWILNSLEFRINEIHKKVKKIEKNMKD